MVGMKSNYCVNLTVRPVTSLAMNRKRRAGPARRLRMRWTDIPFGGVVRASIEKETVGVNDVSVSRAR